VWVLWFQNNKIADTSADQARKGKDIQGIPWDRLSITRETYRQTRLEQYKNYENVPNSGESSGKVSLPFSMSRRFSFSSICFTNIGFQLILIICLMNSGLHGHTERGSFLWFLAEYKIYQIKYSSFPGSYYLNISIFYWVNVFLVIPSVCHVFG